MRSSIIFIFLIIFQNIYGQSYNFKSYSLEDGLPQSQVHDIAQDHFGNFWFATQGGGLSHFNGNEFYNYTKKDGLPSNLIFSIAIDQVNNIWISTEKGISKFNGEKFMNFDVITENDAVIHDLFADNKNRLWFSYPGGGLGCMENDSLIYYGEKEGFTDITSDQFGKIIIATYQDGIYFFENGDLKKNKLVDPKVHLVNSLFVDDNNDLYITTNNDLLLIKNDSLISLTSEIPFKSEFYITDLTKDLDGKLWAATKNGAFNFDGGEVTEFQQFEGLTNGKISRVITDREGSIWLASYGEGVYQFRDDVFMYVDKTHGMKNEVVMAITKDKKGNYWFGTLGGLSKFDGHSVENFDQQAGLPSNYINCLTTDQNDNLWIGSGNAGIIKYTNNGSVNFQVYDKHNSQLLHNRIITSKKDSDGNLWFGTVGGLIKYDGRQFHNIAFDESEAYNLVWSIYPLSNGNILLGTENGLKTYNGSCFESYKGIQVLEEGIILSITSDNKEDFYLGVIDEGIVRYNINTGQTDLFDQEDGLTSTLTYSLTFDDAGNLLAGTENGIDKISFHENGDILLIINYNKNEGFSGIETNHGATYKNADGSIWFGSIKGAFKYNPEADEINLVYPETFLSDVRLFYKKINWDKYADSASLWYDIPINLRLPYEQNHLIFEYFSSSKKNPDKVRYQYKLDPFDIGWSPVTERTEAIYSNIPPGDYLFKVKSCNNDGIWNEDPAVYAFTVVTPFWQRWWFLLLFTAFSLAVLRILYVQRVKVKLNRALALEKAKIEEAEKVRRIVARDFQDELGNHLASISMFVQILKTRIDPGKKEVSNLLHQLEAYSKELYSNAKDFVWSLEPKSDNAREIFLYIKDTGDEIFDKTGIDFIVKNQRIHDNQQYPAGWSRQIVLICKEAFNFYAKSKNAKKLELHYEFINHHSEIKIIAHDVNICEETLNECKSFKIMRKRAYKINNELSTLNGNNQLKIILSGKIPTKG